MASPSPAVKALNDQSPALVTIPISALLFQLHHTGDLCRHNVYRLKTKELIGLDSVYFIPSSSVTVG